MLPPPVVLPLAQVLDKEVDIPRWSRSPSLPPFGPSGGVEEEGHWQVVVVVVVVEVVEVVAAAAAAAVVVVVVVVVVKVVKVVVVVVVVILTSKLMQPFEYLYCRRDILLTEIQPGCLLQTLMMMMRRRRREGNRCNRFKYEISCCCLINPCTSWAGITSATWSVRSICCC